MNCILDYWLKTISRAFIVALVIPVFGMAEDCKRQLSIEEFRALAFHESPLFAQIDTEYARQLAAAFEAAVLLNPEIQFEHTYTRMGMQGANDPQTNASIGQPLRLSDFGAKDRVARLLRAHGDLEKRSSILELSQKLALQYYTLNSLERSVQVIADAEHRTKRKVALIQAGISKGLHTIGDRSLFEGEMYRLQAKRRGFAARVVAAQGELSRLAGISCLVRTVTHKSLEALPSEQQLLERAAQSEFGERARTDAMARLTKAQLRVAELDSMPAITPRILYQHTNDGGDFVGGAVTLPLPLWNRNQGRRDLVRAEDEQAAKRQALVEGGSIDNQVRALRAAAVSAEEQFVIYSNKVLPAFEAALQAQERLYGEGKGNVLQTFEALRTFNETRIEAISHWLEAVSARARLSVLVGEEV